MTQIPVSVWHINEDIINNIRNDKTKESEKLLGQLDVREFFANALSHIISIVAFMLVVGIFTGNMTEIILLIAIVILALSFWGRSVLKKSAVNKVIEYYNNKKQKHTKNK